MFIRRIEQYIAQHGLLHERQEVLVALSGGADSVCMLLVMQRLGYRVQAAHCNFHLRGEESYRDQRFVEELCGRLGVQLHVRHFDTKGEAGSTGESIEMAARRLRYEWFASFGMPVAIAHHRDDSNETMLLNLVRGTGLRGLTGIQPVAKVLGAEVVRPLLCVGRDDILAFLAGLGQAYVTDSTNLECDVKRNIIRNRIMPMLAELNPSVGDTLQRCIGHLCEAQAVCDDALERYAGTVGGENISIAAVEAFPAPLTLLHHILSPYGFTSAVIESVFDEIHGQNGAVYLAPSWRLLRHDGKLLLRKRMDANDRLPDTFEISAASVSSLKEGESYVMDLKNGTETADLAQRQLRISVRSGDCTIIRDSQTAMLDLDSLVFPLLLRHVCPGDRFRPFGMKGSVLVSDYMTNRHLSLYDKEDQLVLVSGEDIVWLVGRRIASSAAVTPKTRRILQMTFVQE